MQTILHRETVHVITNRNATDTNFFQICSTNTFLGKLVMIALIAYPRLDFLKTFLAESILKILKFNSTPKHIPVTNPIGGLKSRTGFSSFLDESNSA